jgi:hydroxymethylglutaryl-CoA lyase
MADRVRIVEVGPRDGLQNEKTALSVSTRVTFIRNLVEAGFDTIEAGSFVSPKWVPQMADTADVLAKLGPLPGVRLPVLVPNMNGFEAAAASRVGEIAVFASASESFSHKNINCSISDSIERFRPVMDAAKAQGIAVRGYVSCVWGCPYEGRIDPRAAVDVAIRLKALGCYEISIADTIGVGTAGAVRDVVRATADAIGLDAVAIHMHDTYGQALANCYAALLEGVRVMDAAAGGLGGCPYAKGASGNMPTEALVYMLDGMGIATGVDLAKLLDAVDFIMGSLGRPSQSAVHRALRA